MTFNKRNTNFYCEQCNKWISIDPCDFLMIYDSVQCFECHHCGYYWDLFPCDYYYILHNQGQCRCVQDSAVCFGKEEDCKYPNGKISYEEDRKEQ